MPDGIIYHQLVVELTEMFTVDDFFIFKIVKKCFRKKGEKENLNETNLSGKYKKKIDKSFYNLPSNLLFKYQT